MPDATQAQRRRKLGLCVACGQVEHAAGRSKCTGCLEAARATAAARRKTAAASGKCEACMRRGRAAERGNRCAKCATKYTARQNARARARRAKGTDAAVAISSDAGSVVLPSLSAASRLRVTIKR